MLSLKIVYRGGRPNLQTNFEARAHSLHNVGVIIQSSPRLIIRSFIWNDAGNWYGSWALGLTESSCSYNFANDSPCNISNYSLNSSAADEISGETVAIKLVTRVFEKIQFAKRALREITLLRHFSNHGNITGLIDVDAISPDFTEMYVNFILVRLTGFAHLYQLYIHGGMFVETTRRLIK